MDLAILAAVAVLVASAAGFAILLRSLSADPQTLPATADWIDELTVEKYRPMLRLLSQDDLRFLASQPGYSAKAARQFRAQRCQIFHGYLRWLRADFGRICTALQVLMVQSQYDRPDLAALLIRQKMMFGCGLLAIRFHLVLYRLGVAGGSVDSLISAFDSLRLELRAVVPSHVGANA